MRSWSVRSLAALVLLVLAPAVAGAPPAAAQTGPVYVPPVDAPVVDPFRPPDGPHGAGNRGLTYDLPSRTPIRAAAAGTVVFAGPVAGTLHVTVLHRDGLRTTYSFLEAIVVRRGQPVAGGAVVGRAGRGFHFGVRAGATYLDPALLFGGRSVVRLVPVDEAPGRPFDEYRAIAEGPVRDHPGLLGRGRRLAADALGWLRARGASGADRLVDALWSVDDALRLAEEWHDVLDWRSRALVSAQAFVEMGLDWTTGECTKAGDAAPRPLGRRIAVLVGGLGSSSESAAVEGIDTDALGYGADVLRFAYGGGRTPGPAGEQPAWLSGVPASRYAPADTTGDVRHQGMLLADLVEQVAAADPGAPIDLFAHSLGGLVTWVALLELADRGALDALGVVVTMGTPHQGADLATIAWAEAAANSAAPAAVLEVLGSGLSGREPAVLAMAETSDLVEDLNRAGIPDGVTFRSLGATTDVVVTAGHTEVPGHTHAVVPIHSATAHDDLPGHELTRRELALAIAGLPPACRSAFETVAAFVVPDLLSWAEDLLGAGLAVS